ncbi:MAG: efflux RND transporter periplasmic adaptor subunit [Bryobacteraceae bacterium]
MRVLRSILIVAAVAAAFLAGRWYSARAPRAPQRQVLYWVDPMHPAYKSDKPGIAPDCGMKLVPVYAGDAPLAGAKTPPGTVVISAEKQQLIGVRIGTAEITAGADTLRATGKVAIDETRVSHVHSRTEGWIDKVYADFTGDVVRKGQPLLTLYSPELLASQQEYLLSIHARDLMRDSPIPGAASDAASLVEASRRRLQLWDLSERQIQELERSQNPLTNTTLYAPASGFVMARNAFPNQKIVPDTELYTVVDLGRVWVLASIFEYQAPLIHVGQAAVVSLPYGGGRSWSARVSYIQPQVDAQTRTIQVRIELPNPGLALKPEMFVNVELRSPGAALLTVPAEAVLDTGLKKTVFVDLGDGHFEPQEVETGERIGDRVAVLKGLAAGERLVVSGNFLINSESQMKAAAGATHD